MMWHGAKKSEGSLCCFLAIKIHFFFVPKTIGEPRRSDETSWLHRNNGICRLVVHATYLAMRWLCLTATHGCIATAFVALLCMLRTWQCDGFVSLQLPLDHWLLPLPLFCRAHACHEPIWVSALPEIRPGEKQP